MARSRPKPRQRASRIPRRRSIAGPRTMPNRGRRAMAANARKAPRLGSCSGSAVPAARPRRPARRAGRGHPESARHAPRQARIRTSRDARASGRARPRPACCRAAIARGGAATARRAPARHGDRAPVNIRRSARFRRGAAPSAQTRCRATSIPANPISRSPGRDQVTRYCLRRFVVPAKAGILRATARAAEEWIPAFAGKDR